MVLSIFSVTPAATARRFVRRISIPPKWRRKVVEVGGPDGDVEFCHGAVDEVGQLLRVGMGWW